MIREPDKRVDAGREQPFLVIVGSGQSPAEHVTIEAQAWIERAAEVFFLLPEGPAAKWLLAQNPRARALGGTAQSLSPMLESLATGNGVCVVFPGHPAFHALSHELLREAQQAGFRAWIAPAVSAEDCLFADLLVDPGRHGAFTFRATEFLLFRYEFDRHSALFLWNVERIGALERPAGLALLRDYLRRFYADEHPVMLYHPPGAEETAGQAEQYALAELAAAKPHADSLLYVPPQPGERANPAVRERLFGTAHGRTDLQVS